MQNHLGFVANDEGLAMVHVINFEFVVLVHYVHFYILSVLLVGCQYSSRALRSERNFIRTFNVYLHSILSPNTKLVDWLSFLIEEGEFMSSLS
jgi:hypothetical protein